MRNDSNSRTRAAAESIAQEKAALGRTSGSLERRSNGGKRRRKAEERNSEVRKDSGVDPRIKEWIDDVIVPALVREYISIGSTEEHLREGKEELETNS